MKRSKSLLLGAALVAGLITAPVVVLPGTPAQAVPNTESESATSAFNTQAVKEMPVNCDPGEFAYGGGGSINVDGGPTGNVALQAVVPVGDPPTGFKVRAAALTSGIASWSVTARALCGASTTNLRVVADDVGPSTLRTKEADARCPDTLRMYGTGFDTSPTTNGTVLVHDVIPGTTLTPRSVTVRATARPNMSPNWSLVAYAICANPAGTMRIDAVSSTSSTSATRDISKSCTNNSTFAHGLGVQTFGATEAVDGQIALNAMQPANNKTVRGIAAVNGALGEPWQLRVYVICAT
jgi:hypothetical protein